MGPWHCPRSCLVSCTLCSEQKLGEVVTRFVAPHSFKRHPDALEGILTVKHEPSKFRNNSTGRHHQMVRRLSERFGWKCWYCRFPLSLETASIDHIIPLCDGGADEYFNLALTCWRCNSAKHTSSLGEYLDWLEWVRFGHSDSLIKAE